MNGDFRINPTLFSLSDSESELLIPICSELDENVTLDEVIPILPMRDTVVFPGVVTPLSVGRNKSVKLIQDYYHGSQYIGVVTQIQPQTDDPSVNDIYIKGTIAQIIKVVEMADGSTSVILHGKKRFTIDTVISTTPYIKATYKLFTDHRIDKSDTEFEALLSSIKDLAIRAVDFSTTISPDTPFIIKSIEEPAILINFVTINSHLKTGDRQRILEVDDQKQQALLLLELLAYELQMLELKHHIQAKVKTDLDQQQREFMLQQQIKTIQNELGDNPIDQEIKILEESATKKKWSQEVGRVFARELKKLARLNATSVEYSNQLNYLHTILDLPWNEYTKDRFDLRYAQKVLDMEHFGLDNVKDRLLEHLAVLKLKKDLKSPILCLVGPPGVGKTSLGRSIAKALGRKYVRMSLGGLHDESEIRGHRKTYIGAMPGRIIQNLRKVKSGNPVFMLDEIDKLGISAQGDPASALLEVLDPEQNNTFYDNFLEIEYDLSKVMFIATANSLTTVSPALRDRMEVIDVNGYVLEEKISIAQKHLIPHLVMENGLKKSQLEFTPESVSYLIENYTRESGVRELDKTIASIIRHIARKIVIREPYNKLLHKDDIRGILGIPRYQHEKYEGNDYAGVVTGLAWTVTGGDILFIETSLSKGNGSLTLTGNLGSVMKESAVIALEYIKSNCQFLQIPDDVFERWNVHVHVPDGAIPKDGPSAGIAMVTAMASAFTRRKVRHQIAMTGEITLRGKVLPVGGIREKILAAKRANITDIFLPAANCKDIEEVNKLFFKGLNFIYVDDVSEVLQQAILEEKVTNAREIE